MALKAGLCTALNQETLEQLKSGGISTVRNFIIKDPEKLSQELHIAYKDICSIRRVLLAEHSAYPVSAASLYQNVLSTLAILSTGCDSLDELLDGGLYTGEVTEIDGNAAAGKSKICLWCAATTVKSENQSVVFIDTCSSFNAETLLDVVTEDCMGDESVINSRLEQIKCMQVFDVFDLFAALDNTITRLNKQNGKEWSNLKLVIIDNVASLIYPIMDSHVAYSQGLISQLGLKLNQLAATHSVAVLVTNNMVSSFNGSDRKPALGKVWSHVPQTRMLIDRCESKAADNASMREACLVKSSRQQTPASTVFSLDRTHHKPG